MDKTDSPKCLRGFCAVASSYHNIANAIKKKPGPSLVPGLPALESIKFAFAGSIAVVFALAYLAMRLGRLDQCSEIELDRLGEIFSKAGIFILSRKMSDRVQDMFQENKASDYTMARVLKWKMLDPQLGLYGRDCHKLYIRLLIKRNPGWPPQVKPELYEALGGEEGEKPERDRISQQIG